MFVPTDKAFRALLVQLGGPDRAEDKFRENPRLLIGVIIIPTDQYYSSYLLNRLYNVFNSFFV